MGLKDLRVIVWALKVRNARKKNAFWRAQCSPIPVPGFPHSQRFIKERKAFEGEAAGNHVKVHNAVDLRFEG